MVEPIDRTEHLERELALARERIRTLEALSGPYRAVFHTSPDAIMVADVDTRLRIANPQLARLLGYESVDALQGSGTSVIDLVVAGHRERARRRFDELLRHGHLEHVEYDLLRADGSTVPIELTASLLRDDAGELLGAVGIARDLTERRRAEHERRQLERQLEQAQRLESLGVLAGGVAHDFNNLLVGILGNVSLLRREIPERWNARGVIDRIESAATRASELTRQMLAYAGHGSEIVGPVDLGVTVRQLAILIEASIPAHVEIRYELTGSLPPVRGDAGQIQQILMNLIINAAEAIGGVPGVVHVTASVAELGPGATDESTGAPIEPGRYVCLEVTDTGGGMDYDTRRRIFDPFFSTKFAGRGLGLAAVAGIVRSHGGAIMLASQPGLGSTFHVYLRPSGGRSPAPAEPPPARAPLAGGHGLVVVADDESLVRSFCRAALEAAGYQVEAAADGLEALAIVKARRDEVTAVLLDLYMPAMDGAEALQRMRALRPALPVLILSGYSEADVDARLGPGVRYLQKPFTLDALLAAVRATLEQPVAGAKVPG